MKKLLSLLGVVTIATSAGATTVLTVTTNTNINSRQNTNILNIDEFENNISLQIVHLKNSYNQLSDREKADVAVTMKKMPELNTNEISEYLSNSTVDFIRKNKTVIENMYLLANSFNTISNTLSVSTQAIDIDWTMINQFVDLDFGASNNYAPSVSTYGPSKWWKFWEWGWKIDFPEGDINVMRVVKLIISLYNGINFAPLESLIQSGKDFFDYLVNLDQHDDDKVVVLYDLIIKTGNDFKISKVPFTKNLYEIFDQFSSILKYFKEAKIAIVKNIIRSAIEKELGISLAKIGAEYSGYLNQVINIINTTNTILDIIKGTIPGIVWNFIVGGMLLISTQMINADQNHNGVNLKFQQFFIPLVFGAK